MIAVLLALALASQFGQRPPLTPAETLLESVVLRAFNDVEPAAAGAIDVITGWDQAAGEVVISCATGGSAAAAQVASKLKTLIEQHQLPQPARTIRFLSTVAAPPGFGQRVKAAPDGTGHRSGAAAHPVDCAVHADAARRHPPQRPGDCAWIVCVCIEALATSSLSRPTVVRMLAFISEHSRTGAEEIRRTIFFASPGLRWMAGYSTSPTGSSSSPFSVGPGSGSGPAAVAFFRRGRMS